jgi:hypothetical protein
VIDLQRLVALCGFSEPADFQHAHRQWVEEALKGEPAVRDERWSEAVAVGSLAFVEKVKIELGSKATHREVERADGTCALRESSEPYGSEIAKENEALTLETRSRGRKLPKRPRLSVVRPERGSYKLFHKRPVKDRLRLGSPSGL